MIRDAGEPLDWAELHDPLLWICAVLILAALAALWILLVAFGTPAPS